jgi:hypothetical protein
MTANNENSTTKAAVQDVCGLPVDTATAFTDHKGVYKKRFEKRQVALLKKLGFLASFLEQDEKILFVTAGMSPFTFLEQLFTGWILYQLKRCMFVLTDRRILHIPTKSNLTYRSSIAQILYADCSLLQIKRRYLVAKYQNGKTEKFLGIPGGPRKKITEILKTIPLQGRSSPMLERAHLCPRCTRPLVTGFYTCPHCSLEFKNKVMARRYSVIFPGGGYFYTRHYFMGIMDAIGELLLTMLVIMALVDIIKGQPDSVFAFGFIGVILTGEKLITIHHANSFINEFIPVDRRITANPRFEPPPTTPGSPGQPEQILTAG